MYTARRILQQPVSITQLCQGESKPLAEVVDSNTVASPESHRTKISVKATTVIGAHALEHMYGRAFLVLIPQIYVALGLAPIQAGLLDAVRQLSGGATSMTGGFFVDMFQHRRAHILTSVSYTHLRAHET